MKIAVFALVVLGMALCVAAQDVNALEGELKELNKGLSGAGTVKDSIDDLAKSLKDLKKQAGRVTPRSKAWRAKAEVAPVDETTEDGLPDDRNAAQGRCEICIFVLEEKEQHRHPLCQALNANPTYQKTCTGVLESLLMYDRWYVWWIYAGCIKRNALGQLEKVRPCPAHAICSWIYNPEDKRPFCPADSSYHPGV